MKIKEFLYNKWMLLDMPSRDPFWYEINKLDLPVRVKYEDFLRAYKSFKKGWTPVKQTVTEFKPEVVVCANDFHGMDHDPDTFSLFIQLLDDIKPDELVIHEVYNVDELSKFPKKYWDESTLQDDLVAGSSLIKVMREVMGDKPIHMPIGNHEERKDKFLDQNRHLSSWDAFNTIKFFKLEGLDVNIHPYAYIKEGYTFTHGNVVRKYSAYSAKEELNIHGKSGMSGHTHRIGSYYQSDLGGDKSWHENGCMCLKNPKYMKRKPNWQQCISVIYFIGNKFHVHQIPVINNWFIFNGKTYGEVV